MALEAGQCPQPLGRGDRTTTTVDDDFHRRRPAGTKRFFDFFLLLAPRVPRRQEGGAGDARVETEGPARKQHQDEDNGDDRTGPLGDPARPAQGRDLARSAHRQRPAIEVVASTVSSAGTTQIAEITLSSVAKITAIPAERMPVPGRTTIATSIARTRPQPAGMTERAVASIVIRTASPTSPSPLRRSSRKRETTSSE